MTVCCRDSVPSCASSGFPLTSLEKVPAEIDIRMSRQMREVNLYW